MKNLKKWLTRIIIVTFIISLLISVIYIIKNKMQDKKQNEIFEELENIVTEKQDENREQQEKSMNLQELYELNNDFVGWIKIEDTIYYIPRLNNKGKQNFEKTKENISKGKVQIRKAQKGIKNIKRKGKVK